MKLFAAEQRGSHMVANYSIVVSDVPIKMVLAGRKKNEKS
jgi:hypothetical protein